MAATKTAKNPTSRNDTPATPSVSESKIARMKVDELRRELTNHGVKGTADLKKPDLVKKLIKAATKSATKSSASRNDTPATPEVSESKIAARKADELRRELRKRGVKGTAELKKPDLVKKMIELETAGATSSAKASAGKASAGKASAGKAVAGKTSVGKASAGRTSAGKASAGKASSAGAKKGKGGAAYAQEISSTADKPERNGRSLVTTDHAVIRQWAKARGAKPATVPDTEHDGHLGVLRLDFPGYRGDRLVEVSWNDWFDAFDKRGLHFIFQQRLASGRRSNFFQLENPDE